MVLCLSAVSFIYNVQRILLWITWTVHSRLIWLWDRETDWNAQIIRNLICTIFVNYYFMNPYPELDNMKNLIYGPPSGGTVVIWKLKQRATVSPDHLQTSNWESRLVMCSVWECVFSILLPHFSDRTSTVGI